MIIINQKENEISKEYENIKLLSDEKRSSILKLLSGGPKRSFKEISMNTEIKPTTLAYHLKVLEMSGFVEKDFAADKGRRDYTRYGVTEVGMEVLGKAELFLNYDGDDDTATVPDRIILIPETLFPRGVRMVIEK